MLPTYEDYKPEPMSLSLEEMASLHREMAEETSGDAEALELYKELYAAAVGYSKSRSSWPLWDREKKQEEDPVRTSRHNKAIIAFNMLARYLRMQGKPAAWRDVLGEESENPYCRKRIGDFACYIVFIGSLNAM